MMMFFSVGGVMKTSWGKFCASGKVVVSFGAAGMIFDPAVMQRTAAGRYMEGAVCKCKSYSSEMMSDDGFL